MATKINQIDDSLNRTSTLRIEGELLGEDALLLERIGVQIRESTGYKVIIDIADLDFMDSDAAPVLRRLGRLEGFAMQGMEIFLQSVINDVERHSA